MAVISYKDIFAPSFWQAWNDFLNQRYTDMWFTGGRGCVAADTLIATPDGEVPIQDFKGGTIYAYDGTNLITAHAFPAEKFSEQDLYVVSLSDGSTITTTDEHRFLTPSNGWIMTKDLQEGTEIAVAIDSQSIAQTSPNHFRFNIHDNFKFNILNKTLFSRQDDSETSLDTLSNWTDAFVVHPNSRALRAATVASVQFSHRAPYYDIFVPVYNNYLSANGILNHNSTKSSFVTMCIVLGMIRDYKEAMAHKAAGNKRWMSYLTHAIIYRKVAADLKDSVYNQVIWSIEKLGLTDKFLFRLSPLRITFKASGQMINFKGLDDPIKSKSIKAPFGYYKYNFFEELNQFSGMEEVRSVRQSIMRGGPEGWQEAEKAVKNGLVGGAELSPDKLKKITRFQSFCAYNPPPESRSWVNRASREDIPTRKVYHSDYRAVPREWLGETFFQEAENLRSVNERAYRHEYLGEVTGNGGMVFENIHELNMSDEMISQFDNIRIGCDFGFARDPAAVTFSHFDRKRGDIYIFKELHKTNLTNPQLAEAILKMEPGYNYIMCDSAEPKSIQELEDCGVNALPVRKTGDSRRFTYKWLQARPHIYVDTRRCPDTFEELILCEYVKDRNGLFISKYPENGGDDIIDSLRYAYMEDATNAGF